MSAPKIYRLVLAQSLGGPNDEVRFYSEPMTLADHLDAKQRIQATQAILRDPLRIVGEEKRESEKHEVWYSLLSKTHLAPWERDLLRREAEASARLDGETYSVDN